MLARLNFFWGGWGTGQVVRCFSGRNVRGSNSTGRNTHWFPHRGSSRLRTRYRRHRCLGWKRCRQRSRSFWWRWFSTWSWRHWCPRHSWNRGRKRLSGSLRDRSERCRCHTSRVGSLVGRKCFSKGLVVGRKMDERDGRDEGSRSGRVPVQQFPAAHTVFPY